MKRLLITTAGLNVADRWTAQEMAALADGFVPAIRRHLRNEIVRAALRQFYYGLEATPAAYAMAKDMAAGSGPTAKASVLAAIVTLNSGKVIRGWQIANIASGVFERSAIAPMQNSTRGLHYR